LHSPCVSTGVVHVGVGDICSDESDGHLFSSDGNVRPPSEGVMTRRDNAARAFLVGDGNGAARLVRARGNFAAG
jgi:hypothetical protein